MRKLEVIFTEGTMDILGNKDNIETSVQFVGENEFITMTFGGRDGSSSDSITLEQLRSIFSRIGIDV